MKSSVSLLLITVACCVFGAARSASAGGSVLFDHIRPESRAALSDARDVSPSLLHFAGCAFAMSRRVQSLSCNARKAPILQALDQQPDDDGQADDDSSTDTDANLAFSEPSYGPAKWRLIRPDTQFANSFINSKSKPPP